MKALMPRFHVALSGHVDVAATRAAIARHERPRHFMLHVADLLGAEIYEPSADASSPAMLPTERILNAQPEAAALAERLAQTAAADDLIFCNSEALSLPLAARLKASGKATKLAAMVHNVARPRVAAASIFGGLLTRHDAIFSVSRRQVEALGKRAQFIEEQIDDAFFTPGPPSPKSRPMIASVGLEQRDYMTLAEASADLPIDVKVSAYSKDASSLARAFPAPLPQNMDQRFYDWPALVQLYRDCDVVVVPLHENRYGAGMTTVLEAMAVGKPVIATATRGLKGVFADETAFRWAPPGDADALRCEIQSLLANEAERRFFAAKGAELFRDRHREDEKAEEMASRLRALI
jgi:hypothetical protein